MRNKELKMKGLTLLIVAAICSVWGFSTLDYKYATVLKEPIHLTRFTKKRFAKFQDVNVGLVEYEYDGSSLYRVNDGLNVIHIESFDRIGNDNVVDIRYRDKNYSYTMHDGEEKYIVRKNVKRLFH